MHDVARLQDHLRQLGRVLLGYSGGVDSALLAVVGARTLGPDGFLAVIGTSASYPDAQYRAALEVAERFAIPVRELATHELDDPRYLANPVNRCYFCKTELWSSLTALAVSEGFDAIIDGTNADDRGEHRPGLAAGAEWRVRSPLAELGFGKSVIRDLSRELGIPGWDAPAAPCLSSRIRYGLAVTTERLRQVESGEALLRRLGLTGDLRVRHLGDRARIEALPDQFARLEECWNEVVYGFARLGFTSVERDPRGYRRGSLLVLEPAVT
ncbi:MAG TPA: ATP-dependent sacrificial sulfur transferase LarE [Gemmatimonadales bacterium]|nr:ATP-dependent sacrificial sulfur transferase LarE [Gemmatimonadales bacterium]